MVDLSAIPYCLSAEDVEWVENTIGEMSDEEKVGQLFFALTARRDEEHLSELVKKYHVGGCRYNAATSDEVKRHNKILREHTKIPLFIACNTERGGDGAASDGCYIGSGIKIAATNKNEYAYSLGRLSNLEAASLGCNMAFAPVCDLFANWQNTEISSRAFGSDTERVTAMSLEYVRGAHSVEGFASVAKHFPGNGYDLRDAHLSNCVMPLGEEEWEASFGHIYRELFASGVDAVMGGHIMMPQYMKDVYGVTDPQKLLPATLCPEIMTHLLRKKLGFNGLAISDASHMVAMNNRMTRREMLPTCINAGCDMFLFFNDPKEDFETMLSAYQSRAVSEERMTEALRRILGLKAKMGLHKRVERNFDYDPTEARRIAEEISRDSITLVKYKDSPLPLSPKLHKKITVVPIRGNGGAMEDFFKMAMGGEGDGDPAGGLCERLCRLGFDATVYESPLSKIKELMARGETPSLDLYFSGNNSIEEFLKKQDLIITLFDVSAGRPALSMSKGGGETPWYVFELPVIGISLGAPTMLADLPQLRTYINAYDAKPHTLDALVEKLVSGAESFSGIDPIDSYCGMCDTRI